MEGESPALNESSKIKNLEKKVASVKEKKNKKTSHIKESEKKFKTNYLKKVIALLLKYK